MERRVVFEGRVLPYVLLMPQLLVVLIFFYWPAAQALHQSVLLEDAFGITSRFVWFENFSALMADPDYGHAFGVTLVFSVSVAVLSLSLALLLAVLADQEIRGQTVYRTMLVWPYALAPAVVGVLWIFMFHPSLGMLGRQLRDTGLQWNPTLNGTHAVVLVVLAAAWKQVSYNFLFFLAGLQAIPKSVIEAAKLDGAGAFRRFLSVTLPLLVPTLAFLITVNIVYAFFDTFGIIDTMTAGGPARATQTLVYKVFSDGRSGGNLGTSAAQSVILMVIVIALTAIQIRFVERKVT